MSEHHAIVFFGSQIEQLPIQEAYKKVSQDVTHVITERFGIDDARSVTVQAIQRPVALSKRVFVIVTSSITVEAQNALLKLFEEPPQTTQFYIVVPNDGVLISTLRSRLQEGGIGDTDDAANDAFASFAASSYAQRLSMVANIAKAKDKKAFHAILDGTEKFVSTDVRTYQDVLAVLMDVRSYATLSGTSIKILLEEIALSLPKECDTMQK